MWLKSSNLTTKIKDLKLDISGTELEKNLGTLYLELESVGLSFKPTYYFTDEWGCPNNVPVIGIPFYLADESLTSMHHLFEDESVMKILRHEAGHCFNYAYELHRDPEWRAIFGDYQRPYLEQYPRDETCNGYVNYLGDCYSQKHPDEDFAETFGAWLDPSSEWRISYANKPGALNKLKYVDRLVRETILPNKPINLSNQLDKDVSSIDQTVEEFLHVHSARQ